MISKQNEVKRSKVVLAFWMQKGWMQYVSLKKPSFRNVPEYTMELFHERERLMNRIIDKETELEDGTIQETPELKQQMKEWEEIYQTIELELSLLHERYQFADLYKPEHHYRGFEVFCYEDDIIPEGFYCKVEQLDLEFENEEDYATYIAVDTPVTLLSLFENADSILHLDTHIDDPAIEITLLSKEEVEKLRNEKKLFHLLSTYQKVQFNKDWLDID